jgi:hypothetical protein
LVEDSPIAACTALVLKPLLDAELLVPIAEEFEAVLEATQGFVLIRFR